MVYGKRKDDGQRSCGCRAAPGQASPREDRCAAWTPRFGPRATSLEKGPRQDLSEELPALREADTGACSPKTVFEEGVGRGSVPRTREGCSWLLRRAAALVRTGPCVFHRMRPATSRLCFRGFRSTVGVGGRVAGVLMRSCALGGCRI